MMFGSSFWGWLADNYGRKFVSFLHVNAVKPLFYSHSREQDNWPFNGGSHENNIGRDPVFSLSNVHVHVSTNTL